MRVFVTLDYWDGSKSKATEMDLDGMPMSQFSFMMMKRGVAGITITHKSDLTRMVEQASGKERGELALEKPEE